jgi:hypothetical protein
MLLHGAHVERSAAWKRAIHGTVQPVNDFPFSELAAGEEWVIAITASP